MKTALFKKYQELDEEYKKLEERRKEVREAIVEELQKEGISTLDSDHGKFTIATRTSYSYSDKVKALEEKVKIAKVREQQKGIAQTSETQYLVFTQVAE
jgi:aspartate/tyrosine/aromatic aminotransferase